MIYFTVKNELILMRSLLNHFELISSIENDVRNQLVAKGTKFIGPYDMFKRIREEAANPARSSDYYYKGIREDFAKLIPAANMICEREKISWHRQGRSAEIEGAMPFQGSIFELVLNRPSDIMDLDNDVRDTINQTIGILERKEKEEFNKLINPFFWLKEVFIFIVRLPYNVLELSGFNVEKIQEHLFARLFQLIYIIALILVLIWFGLESIIDIKTLLIP